MSENKRGTSRSKKIWLRIYRLVARSSNRRPKKKRRRENAGRGHRCAVGKTSDVGVEVGLDWGRDAGGC